MSVHTRLSLTEIESIVCHIAAKQLNFPRQRISPSSRLIEDLDADSMEMIELLMELEEHFHVTLPTDDSDIICKSLFAREGFSLGDLSEMVYVSQESGRPKRDFWSKTIPPHRPTAVPFCQLGGMWNRDRNLPLFESLSGSGNIKQFRRRSDGMRCLLIPKARVEIGTDENGFDQDARPRHSVELDAFLIDAEVVSTTAYCRFLNSIGEVSSQTLLDWFVLSEADDRVEHQLIHRTNEEWLPISGCERRPMILVSWYGANAYSLWANGHDWRSYRGKGKFDATSFLPTEAQWEYAARGTTYRTFPWGDDPPDNDKLNVARHVRGTTYDAESLPLIDVNVESGMSPFGLHQMAGNVWQWCRDWYSPGFYATDDAKDKNAWNCSGTGIRSERGGSWVGSQSLCRSSYRRGRSPCARGRCLGFRCVSDVTMARK